MSFRKLLRDSPSLYVPPCQNKLLEDHIISPLCICVRVCGCSSIGKWSWPICLDTAGALLAPQIGDHQPHNCVAEPPMPHSLYIKGVLLLLRFNVIPIIQERPCVGRRPHPCNNSAPSHHSLDESAKSQHAALSRLVWLWLDTPGKVHLTNLPCRPEAMPLQAHAALMADFCRFSQAPPHFPQKCGHNQSAMTPQGLVMHTTVPSRCKTNSKTL